MLGFDPNMLDRMRAHEERVLQGLRDRDEFESELHAANRRTVQSNRGGGGAGLSWKICKITNFTAGNQRFRCKDIDAQGNEIGTAFDVYVWSLSEQTNQIGLLDLSKADRRYVVGMYVRVWSQQMPMAFGSVILPAVWVAVDDALEVCTT